MESRLVPVKIDRQWKVIASDSSEPPFYWRVTLGKKHTGGKKQRRFFTTQQEAEDFIATAAQARIAQGQEAFSIPQRLRVEAMECARRLKATGASLTQAVDYFLRHAVPKGGHRTFEALAKEFLVSRRAMNCRPSTVKMYTSFLKILGESLGKKRVNEITTDTVEKWLSEYRPKSTSRSDAVSCSQINPRTRKNYLVTLKTVFEFAEGRGYCSHNPAARISNPIQEDKPTGVLTPNQATALLQAAAVDRAPSVLPGIAIGLFAGLRRSEICALDWSEVNLESATIEVKGIKSKTRRRRIVSMEANLIEWLRPYAKEEGRVAPCPDVFGERVRDLVRAGYKSASDSEKAKPIIEEWPQNALRHSFGSYFYGRTKNENLTAAQMGNTPDVVHAHYKALVREADTTAYWSIRPSSTTKQRRSKAKRKDPAMRSVPAL